MKRKKRKVKIALEKTNEVMEQKFNIWVDGSHYNDRCPLKKLLFKRVGPFPIIQKVGDTAYKLKIPNT